MGQTPWAIELEKDAGKQTLAAEAADMKADQAEGSLLVCPIYLADTSLPGDPVVGVAGTYTEYKLPGSVVTLLGGSSLYY